MNPLVDAGLVFATQMGKLMLEHPELFRDIVDMINGGADPELIKKTIRDLKLTISDQAMKEELDRS